MMIAGRRPVALGSGQRTEAAETVLPPVVALKTGSAVHAALEHVT